LLRSSHQRRKINPGIPQSADYLREDEMWIFPNANLAGLDPCVAFVIGELAGTDAEQRTLDSE
jgi:hypothetical protein